ncbi:lipopolysaccharide assembly protein LapA domain-containing protein [Sporosarcina sp. FSL K6-1522]|uniref:LapA family protein n=1 Tax=Sporosarcina sp. FSL K6-1522 TaxID=2921554 RepID=UPI00315A4F6D
MKSDTKIQWNLLLGLLFAIIIATFAVINVEPVEVNYLVAKAQWPLVLVILGSALLGAAVSGLIAIVKSTKLHHRVKIHHKEMEAKEQTIALLEKEIVELKKQAVSALIKKEDHTKTLD